MGDFLRVLQDMGKGFLLVPFFRMLFYGIIFSAVVTFLIGFTEDVFRLSPNFPYIANANHSFWIPVFSCLSAFCSRSWAIEQSATERRHLEPGEAEACRALGGEGANLENRSRANRPGPCRHALHDRIEDVGRKLILHFDVTDSDVFADQSLDITNVMIASRASRRSRSITS